MPRPERLPHPDSFGRDSPWSHDSWEALLSGPATSGGRAVEGGVGGADEFDGAAVFSVVRSGAALVGEGPAFCAGLASRPMTTPIPPRSNIATTAITVGRTHCPDRLPTSCVRGIWVCGIGVGGICAGGIDVCGICVGAIAKGSY